MNVISANVHLIERGIIGFTWLLVPQRRHDVKTQLSLILFVVGGRYCFVVCGKREPSFGTKFRFDLFRISPNTGLHILRVSKFWMRSYWCALHVFIPQWRATRRVFANHLDTRNVFGELRLVGMCGMADSGFSGKLWRFQMQPRMVSTGAALWKKRPVSVYRRPWALWMLGWSIPLGTVWMLLLWCQQLRRRVSKKYLIGSLWESLFLLLSN